MTLKEAAGRLGRSKSTLQYYYRQLPDELKGKDERGRILVSEAAFAELTRLTRFDAVVDAPIDAVDAVLTQSDAPIDAVLTQSDAVVDVVDAVHNENVDAVLTRSDAVPDAPDRADDAAHTRQTTADIAISALTDELAALRSEKADELDRLRAECDRLKEENSRLNSLLADALSNVTRLADQAQQLQAKQLQQGSHEGIGKRIEKFFARLLPEKTDNVDK